jgi:L-cysteine:1D-myo-inositol 2-amino-2-deoxy-alpha-D-glucopyranoside ligase
VDGPASVGAVRDDEPDCKTRVWDSLRRGLVALPYSRDPERPGGRLLKLYVCGVTPYDSGHLGHAFTFAAFDVLVRWVEACGIRVRYVQNITDVDDPLFERARHDGVRWNELAEREILAFRADMEALGWRAPDLMPRVSEEVPSITSAVQRLAEAGFAYQTDAVYFPAGKYAGYGELSHYSRRSMIRKLREEGLLGRLGPGGKREPLDFPLWRPSEPDEPAWPSEFGSGRPGWHIECSAMSIRYLGPQIDIHGGGRDLIFSHHESERAQSECLTGCVPFARAWLHTGMVRYGGHKMSKSLGNLVVVRETLERAPAAAVRLYLASHRYRTDWTFRWEGLARAARLSARLADLLGGGGGGGAGPPQEVGDGGRRPGPGASADLVEEFSAALDDDLDTPRAVRVLRAAVRRGDAASARWMTSILCGSAALV